MDRREGEVAVGDAAGPGTRASPAGSGSDLLRALAGPVVAARSVLVGEGSLLGCPSEERVRDVQLGRTPPAPGAPVLLGERCLVRNGVIVGEGSTVGQDCVLEDRVRIGYGCRIGDRVRFVHGAYVCDRVVVGDDAVVAGFVCDGSRIGDRCSVMGSLVHEYARPHLGWWGVDEEPPLLEPDTVVGYGACVVGGVRLGPRVYVAAGATVTKDVPPGRVVTGCNEATPLERWPGGRLRELVAHWRLAASGTTAALD